MNQRGFVIPSFLLSPTGLMGTAIVLLSLSNLMFFKLWRGAVDDYAQFRADVVAQQKQLEAEADKARAESERISADTATGWAAAVDYWRNRPAGSVRVSAHCDPAGLRPVSPTGQNIDGPSIERGLDSAVDVALAECGDRLNNAVLDAAQVIWLQDWIKKQHGVSR